MNRTRFQTSFVLTSALVVGVWTGGCADSSTATLPRRFSPPAANTDATQFWEAGASVLWNQQLRDLIAGKPASGKPNQQATIRAFTYLSLAQYDAIVAAEDGKVGRDHASARGAVAGASAAVLEYLFPADAVALEAAVNAQRTAAKSPGEKPTDFVAGERIGRATGAAVVAAAKTDGFSTPWTGTVPTGAGLWFSSARPPAPPVLPRLGEMRTFFMTSGSQFRPGPPPAFGSPDYLAALAEVRTFSDTRTADQLTIARYWAGTTGALVGGFWNTEIADLVVSHRLDERRAAHAFALVNMAIMDANIACHDAKYAYWLIRPSQADPAITTPVGLPNHPSYPSNHGCDSGAAAYVLSALFPDQAQRLGGMAKEAAESRLYAGIHYRFDAEAGLRIGRQVADLALASDVRGHAEFALP